MLKSKTGDCVSGKRPALQAGPDGSIPSSSTIKELKSNRKDGRVV